MFLTVRMTDPLDYTYHSIQGPNGAHRTHRTLDHAIAYDRGGGAGGAAAVFGVVYVWKDMCFSLSLSLLSSPVTCSLMLPWYGC